MWDCCVFIYATTTTWTVLIVPELPLVVGIAPDSVEMFCPIQYISHITFFKIQKNDELWDIWLPGFWIKNYRHWSSTTQRSMTSSKSWKYYKANCFLSFLAQFLHNFFSHWLVFLLRGRQKMPWIRLRKLLAFFFKGLHWFNTFYCTQKWVRLTCGRRS